MYSNKSLLIVTHETESCAFVEYISILFILYIEYLLFILIYISHKIGSNPSQEYRDK